MSNPTAHRRPRVGRWRRLWLPVVAVGGTLGLLASDWPPADPCRWGRWPPQRSPRPPGWRLRTFSDLGSARRRL